MKICPEGAEWFHVGGSKEGRKDGRTDIQFRQTYRRKDVQTDIHDETNSRFSQLSVRA